MKIHTGPIFKLGIIVFGTKNILEYSSMAFSLLSTYAEYHGYDLVIYDENHLPETLRGNTTDARWNKIYLLWEALDPQHGIGRLWDYAVWMDADAVILNPSFRWEQIIRNTTKTSAQIWVSAEHEGSTTRINSGVILVRNSRWTRSFLWQWWTTANRVLYSDQEQFDLMYTSLLKTHSLGDSMSLRAPITEYIDILPPATMNSNPPAMVRQGVHDNVLHLMGEHDRYRARVFSHGARTLCDWVTNASARLDEALGATHQLGMHQPHLLLWTVDFYYEESLTLLHSYRDRVNRGIPQSLQRTRSLSNSVHHFAHAIETLYEQRLIDNAGVGVQERDVLRADAGPAIVSRFVEDVLMVQRARAWEVLSLNGNSSSPSPTTAVFYETLWIATLLRHSVYELLVANSRLSSQNQSACVDITSDQLELWKATAEAGQNLIHAWYFPELHPSRRKLLLADEVFGWLHGSIRRCCHHQQAMAVDIMIAQLHVDIGWMLLRYPETTAAVMRQRRAWLVDPMALPEFSSRTNASDYSHSLSLTSVQYTKLALVHCKEALRLLTVPWEEKEESIAEIAGKHLLAHPYQCLLHAHRSPGGSVYEGKLYEQQWRSLQLSSF